MKRKILVLLVAVLMVASLVYPSSRVYAASAGSISLTKTYNYFPYDGSQSSGTPFAYYVEFTGNSANHDYYLVNYFYVSGSNNTKGFIWNGTQWTKMGSNKTQYMKITTDSSKKWSGWIFGKTDKSYDFGQVPNYRVRIYDSSSSAKSTATVVSIHLMDMDGSHSSQGWVDTQGGWIEGTAYDTSGNPVSDYIVVVKDSNGHLVGAYMTEDNGIDDGYSTTTGYYKVAVPAGSGYSVELWDPSTNSIVGQPTENVSVTAHQTTSDVDINSGGSSTLSVTTNPASDILSSTATLNGTLDNLGSDSSATVYFEWGTDTSYGNETSHQTLNAAGSFTANLTGLTPGTTYHFRAVAVGSPSGTVVYGNDMSFTTLAPPSVQTDSATNVTKTTANLNGTLTDLGSDSSATVYFEWGTDTSYGNETSHQTLNAAGSFTANLTGLTPGTTYHFRAVAVNSAGTSYGSDQTFSTYEATTPVVLFDDTKDETAGNADWVIDGAYSDWADALRNAGFIVESLDSGPISTSVLNGINVFVIPEPQDEFTTDEITAIKTFVNNGGGLVLIADHLSSDRNNNGHDSPHIYDNNFGVSDFGFTFDLNQFSEDPINNVNHTIYHDLTNGVNSIGIWAGSTISITDSSKAKGVIFSNDNSKIIVVGAEVGSGRVAAIGDSSPFDDGTGHPGNHLYDGWNDYDDAQLGIDMVKWCSEALLSAPTVKSVSPVNGATGVNVNTTISATFDKPMDSSTITTSTFTVKDSSGNSVSGTVAYDDTTKTATFTPNSALSYDTTYTATISGTVKDAVGNALGSDYSWSFTTMAVSPPSAPQNLTATADSANKSITLSWAASTPGTFPIGGYAIYRGTSAGGESGTPIATVDATTTTYTDANLPFGTYYYYVKAFDNQTPPDYSQPSNEVSATIQMSITPIGDARSMAGQTVLIRGTATVPSGVFSTKYFYIQDGTGGIEVYCHSGVGTINLNDVYEVKGKIYNFHGTIEIEVSQTSDITFVSHGTPILPEQINLADISNYYGELVVLSGTVSSKRGTSFIIEDQDGNSAKVYVRSSTHIDTSNIEVGDLVKVTGIAETYRGTSEIMPRFQSDITKFAKPVVQTHSASNVTQTTATLNGTLESPGTASQVTVYFEWGTDTVYGHETSHLTKTVPGDFSANIVGLAPNTTYHYRAVAVSSVGTSYGSDVTFRTKSAEQKNPNNQQEDTIPPTVSIPEINIKSAIVTNSSTFSFTIVASDNSGIISRTVVKDNGIKIKDVHGLPKGGDPTITLFEGINDIEVTVYDAYGNYTSKKFRVISDTKAPVLELSSEIPESVATSKLTIAGKVLDTTTGIASFTVNGKNVSVRLNGSFSYILALKPGVNKIVIKIVDRAGNVFKKTYDVKYIKNAQKIFGSIITLQINNPFISVNGTKKRIDSENSKPIIKNNRTLVPIRVIVESLGGTISWNGKTREVTINLNGNTIVLTIDKNTALVNGIKTPIDSDNPSVKPIIINGRTYLPLRFIAEQLGCTVDWDPATKTITIYYFG